MIAVEAQSTKADVVPVVVANIKPALLLTDRRRNQGMQAGHTEIIHEMEQHIGSAFRAKSFVVSDSLLPAFETYRAKRLVSEQSCRLLWPSGVSYRHFH